MDGFRAVAYVEGADLFRVICDRDMEGIVAKLSKAQYTPDATTWVKIKNRQYSQAVGRADFFDGSAAHQLRSPASVWGNSETG